MCISPLVLLLVGMQFQFPGQPPGRPPQMPMEPSGGYQTPRVSPYGTGPAVGPSNQFSRPSYNRSVGGAGYGGLGFFGYWENWLLLVVGVLLVIAAVLGGIVATLARRNAAEVAALQLET